MVSTALESSSVHPSGRTEPEMSVSVTLTCQEILSGRLCGLLIGQPGQCEPIGGESAGDIGSGWEQLCARVQEVHVVSVNSCAEP